MDAQHSEDYFAQVNTRRSVDGLLIRDAVPDDYARLLPIAEEVHALHATAHPEIFRPVAQGISLSRRYFDELLDSKTSSVHVAQVENSIAGFVIANVFDTPPYDVLVPRRVVFIENMAVTVTQRQKGIGRALVEAVMAWGRGLGATTLELTVWNFNEPARHFYEQLGLTQLSHSLRMDLS